MKRLLFLIALCLMLTTQIYPLYAEEKVRQPPKWYLDFWTDEHKYLYLWTKAKMETKRGTKVDDDHLRPLVFVVSSRMFKAMFRLAEVKGIEKYRKTLIVEEGKTEAEADEKITGMIDNIAAFYDPRRFLIVIAKDRSICSQRARIVHEFIHYFQLRFMGTAQGAGYRQKRFAESEAVAMEGHYGMEYCKEEAQKWELGF